MLYAKCIYSMTVLAILSIHIVCVSLRQYPNGRRDGEHCDIYWNGVHFGENTQLYNGKVNKFPGKWFSCTKSDLYSFNRLKHDETGTCGIFSACRAMIMGLCDETAEQIMLQKAQLSLGKTRYNLYRSWSSRSWHQGQWFSFQLKARICHFLLVINSNLDPISYRFWDMASFRWKDTFFSTPLHPTLNSKNVFFALHPPNFVRVEPRHSANYNYSCKKSCSTAQRLATIQLLRTERRTNRHHSCNASTHSIKISLRHFWVNLFLTAFYQLP